MRVASPGMDRRTLLGRAVAGLTACVSLSVGAGCLGGGQEESVLAVTGRSFERGENDTLVYRVTVSNPSDRSGNGQLYVNTELNGAERTRTTGVSVPAHATTTVAFAYNVTYGELSESVSPSVDLREGEPTETDA